jgi:hypothetical protein
MRIVPSSEPHHDIRRFVVRQQGDSVLVRPFVRGRVIVSIGDDGSAVDAGTVGKDLRPR